MPVGFNSSNGVDLDQQSRFWLEENNGRQRPDFQAFLLIDAALTYTTDMGTCYLGIWHLLHA